MGDSMSCELELNRAIFKLGEKKNGKMLTIGESTGRAYEYSFHHYSHISVGLTFSK